MKLQTIYLIAFVIFLIGIEAAKTRESFLKYVGSYKYNTTDNGKTTLKHYYSSHRIAYKWIEAFMVCKSVGMRMASIETNDELNILAGMGRKNIKLFEQKVFVETLLSHYLPPDEEKSCYSLQKLWRQKAKIVWEKCNSDTNKFLCEKTEVVDSYEGDKTIVNVDVKATFFKYIGNFETKKYFASFDLKAQSNDVPKMCESFGMQMASPKNQAEYDNLGRVLLDFKLEWTSMSIAGYRSDENENEWVASNGPLNYEINWRNGEPNNGHGHEHCIVLANTRPVSEANDVPCYIDNHFVCELDDSISDVNALSQIDAKLLKPLTNYKIGSTKKEIFVSLYDVDWLAANLMCRNYGMELFTPSSTTDDETLRQILIEIQNTWDSLHVGLTSMGTSDIWYSVHGGEVLDFDLEWVPQNYNSIDSDLKCLKLIKYNNEEYAYDVVTCTNKLSHFICQNVVEVTGDERKIEPKSPVAWILDNPSITTEPPIAETNVPTNDIGYVPDPPVVKTTDI